MITKFKALNTNGTGTSPLYRTKSDNVSCLFRSNKSMLTSTAKDPTNQSSLNISDLAYNNTINVKSTPTRLSFEPGEITGRSTTHLDRKTTINRAHHQSSPSVNDILASSMSAEIRKLSLSVTERLNEIKNGNRPSLEYVPLTADHTVDSSFSFGEISQISKSNDKQKKKQTHDEWSDFGFECNKKISDSIQSKTNISELGSFSSVTEERFMSDQQDWENEMADIPGQLSNDTNLSPIEKVKESNVFADFSRQFDKSDYSLSSISAFFQMKSDDIKQMIPNKSPERRKPIALIEPPTPPTKNSATFSSRAERFSYVIDSLYKSDITVHEKELTFLNSYLDGKVNKENLDPKLKKSTPYYEICSIIDKMNQPSLSDTASFTDSLLDSSTFRSKSQFTADGARTTDFGTKTYDLPVSDLSKTKKRSRSSLGLSTDVNYREYVNEPNRAKSPTIEYQQSKSTSASAVKKTTPGQLVATKSSPLYPPPQTSISSGNYSLPAYPQIRGKSVSPSSHRSNSQCSQSSEYSDRSGSLPIKSTHGELSWGSVKLRKTVEKTIQLKNVSSKRLSLRLTIFGPGFQLSGAEQNGSLTLQSLECRSILFSFCPTVIGPAVGKVIISYPVDTGISRTINLYGYGGHMNIVLDGVQKGPIGSAFLPLGDISELKHSISKTFTVTNRGTLPGFVSIEFQSKGKDIHYMNTSLFVERKKVIVEPQKSSEIKVTFKPNRDEIKKLIKKNSDVLVVANLVVITGDEPGRMRIKRLIKEARSENKKNVQSTLNELCTSFYRESVTDTSALRESFSVIDELIGTFKTYELSLTINRNLDETLVNFGLETDDESLLFQTLASESLMIDNPLKVP